MDERLTQTPVNEFPTQNIYLKTLNFLISTNCRKKILFRKKIYNEDNIIYTYTYAILVVVIVVVAIVTVVTVIIVVNVVIVIVVGKEEKSIHVFVFRLVPENRF